MKNTVTQAQQANLLYMGTSESVAKVAPLKGLQPPTLLTDIYPGFFCLQERNNVKWGIISINIDKLYVDMFAPFHAYMTHATRKINKSIHLHKNKWKKSLEECGVCAYLGVIPPAAIVKVMIYTPVGRHGNKVINRLVAEPPNPFNVTPKEHKFHYSKKLGVTRWLNGEYIKCEDIYNGETTSKLVSQVDCELADKYGLDVYYQE